MTQPSYFWLKKKRLMHMTPWDVLGRGRGFHWIPIKMGCQDSELHGGIQPKNGVTGHPRPGCQ